MKRTPCDRAEITFERIKHLMAFPISPDDRSEIISQIRMALDTEVKCGGPWTCYFVIDNSNLQQFYQTEWSLNMRTYTIELRVDFDTLERESKEKAMENVVRTHARAIKTAALLLSDKRKPQIMLTSGDMMEADKEIDLAEEMEPLT